MVNLKVDIKDVKECQKLLKIQVEPERILDEYQSVLKEFVRSVSVPGFRTGKAPSDLIKTHYGPRIKEETLNRLIHEASHDAITTNKIEFVGYPKVEQIEFEIEKPAPKLNFSMTVDTLPEFKLKPYKNIKIKKKSFTVEENEIQKTLQALQEQNAQFKTIDSRPAQMGDYIVCDYKVFSVGGNQIDARQNIWLCLEENSQMPGLAKGLLGADKETTRQIELTLPENYPKKEYKNTKSTWHISVRQIKEKILPVIDDEFAKDIGNFKNLDELKAKIKDQMQRDKQQKTQLDMRQQIFDSLLKTTQFGLPSSLLKRQTERLVNDAKIRLLYQGLKKEQIDSQQALLEEKLKPDAENQLKLFFILERISDEQNVTVTDKDTEDYIDSLSKSSHQTKEETLKYINENDLMDDVRMQLRHEKVTEFLLKDAVVEEER